MVVKIIIAIIMCLVIVPATIQLIVSGTGLAGWIYLDIKTAKTILAVNLRRFILQGQISRSANKDVTSTKLILTAYRKVESIQ